MIICRPQWFKRHGTTLANPFSLMTNTDMKLHMCILSAFSVPYHLEIQYKQEKYTIL